MLKLHEKYSIEILDLGKQGEGIGRIFGQVVFVPETVPGDFVIVEIVQIKRNYARGKILEIVEKSQDRISPACPYADQCGGCSFQHLDYEAQVKYKEAWLKNALERIGGVEDPLILESIGMDDPWRYRNKAGYKVGENPVKQGDVAIGFYKKRSHEIVDCHTCLLQTEAADQIVRALRPFAKENRWLESVVIKTAFGTGEIMLVLGADKKHSSKLNPDEIRDSLILALEDTLEDPYEIESLILKVADRNTEKNILLAGKSTITDNLLGMNFEISADSFYQVNPLQTEKLYEKVIEFADLKGHETVLDLYCGVGTIGLILSKKAKWVMGIESVKQAVLDANRNAVINGIVNAEFIHRRAEEVLGNKESLGQLSQLDHEPSETVVVLDPPRAGCHPDLLEAVAKAGAERVVYVSCDPATLARDIKIMASLGYKFEKAQAVDMFPHTRHVECVALMSRIIVLTQ